MKPRNKKDRSWANNDIPIPGPSSSLNPTSSTSNTLELPGTTTGTTGVGRTPGDLDENPSTRTINDADVVSTLNNNDDNDESISDLEWMRRRMSTTTASNVLEVTNGVVSVASGAVPSLPTAPLTQAQAQAHSNSGAATSNGINNANASVSASSGPEPMATATATGAGAGAEANPSTEDREDVATSLNQTPRLFLRNLAYSCSTSELQEAFGKFGEVVQAHIPVDPTTQSSKGMAYITFASSSSALSALQAMDKSAFQGRILHVMPAVSRRGRPEDEGMAGEGGEREKSLKERRLQKSKDVAGKEFNWAMLYMNSDAIVSSVADRLKISKADILNPEGDDAAVKLALAETHVIQETKKYLETEGVLLESFQNSRTPRSDTVILVKNIPYGTTLSQLEEIFSPHGEITRLLLPPAGTIAVVEYSNAGEAGKAFRGVAYRRLGSSVIYLEKAPMGIFKDEVKEKQIKSGVKPVVLASETARTTITSETDADGDAVEASKGDDASTLADVSSPTVGATLFVKNLNFSTTTDKLVKTFRSLPSFAFARVQTKPDPKSPGQTLSMGYGFVGFKDKEGANKAMKTMQGFVLDGHALVVKFAMRGVEEKENGTSEKALNGVGKSGSAKMIVKNLPFEATKKDVRALFGAHGQLKSVRLPKKFNSSSRGFAFLEFVSRKEAENAFEALKHTHLLGRHVVIEWAAADENGAGGVDIEAIRERVKSAYGDGKEERPGKKRKLDLDGALGAGDGDDGDGFIAV